MELNRQGVDEIFAEIQQNLAKLQELLEKVERATDISAVEDEVIAHLESLARSFAAMAEKQAAVNGGFRGKLEELGSLGDRSAEAINLLMAKRESWQVELQDLAYEADLEVRRIKEQSLKTRLQFVEMRLELWNKLLETQKQIAKNARQMADEVKYFFLTLDENAKVYEEALETAKLHRDLNAAVRTLSGIHDVSELSRQIQESWQILLKLIQKMATEGLISTSSISSSSLDLERSWPKTFRLFAQLQEQEGSLLSELAANWGGE